MTPSPSEQDRTRRAAVAGSPLTAKIVTGLFDEGFLARMADEARSLYPGAALTESDGAGTGPDRGGDPTRRFWTVTGGPVQAELYRAEAMLRFLEELAAVAIAPAAERGSYSFYVSAGDRLGIHRDIEGCDLTVVTCIEDPADLNVPALRLYPERADEPLAEVRARPDEGAVEIALLPGESLVFWGGTIPHEALPVSEGRQRIVSTLCYRIR